MKMIEISDKGHVWHVPLRRIAEHRANFYKNDPDTTRQKEIDFVMGDDFEGLDWLANNMNFEDYEDVAILVKSPAKIKPDIYAEKRIIEVSG